MTRVGKYMVYNPRKDKPVKYYDDFETAQLDSSKVNFLEGTDILILKVVANMEVNKFKVLNSEFKNVFDKTLEVIED